MKAFEEKTISSKKIYDGRIITLQVDDVRLPNGKTSTRELVKHPGAVAIIPLTKNKKIIFVEQYRKPIERSLVEIPAGRLEVGEHPEITAVRELEEETGYTTEKLSYVSSFYTSPGFADELIHIYLTDELIRVKNPAPGDEDEFVRLVELTLEEAQAYVNEKKIHDAKTNYALLYLQTLELI